MTDLPHGAPADVGRRRADHALQAVLALQDEPYGHYVSYVKSLAPAIVANGLGQALATERAGSEKDPGHRQLYDQVECWLLRDWPQRPPNLAGETVLEAIFACGQREYVRMQGEAIEYAGWLKKFAVAFLVERTG